MNRAPSFPPMIFPAPTFHRQTAAQRRRFRPAAPAPARWPVAILGVPFDSVTIDSAIARIADMIASRRPAYVVTPNVDFLVQARRDAELRRILLEAHLVLCDGQPLVWASRWLGNPLPERVAGADLVPRFIALAAQRGFRLFLLGATPEANSRAVARLQERHPGLVVAGHYSPPFRSLEEMDNAEIVRRIQAARPDVVLVSFGCPKQEKWIARNYGSLGVPVCIGVGATIDFLAGQVRRAPRWMQRSGLEWIYRLAQEPRRLFRRYAVDLRIFSEAIFAQWWRMHRWGKPGASAVSDAITWSGPRWQVARVTGHLDRPAIERAADAWREIGDRQHDCLLDLAEVDFIDSTGAALLVARQKQQHQAGRRLVLFRPSEPVRRSLGRMNLLSFLELAESTPVRDAA
ncbi:anti-anti-sigma factor/polymer biosynthesis protein, WecB/TagA/CpsF family [Opitutus sp. GAS368]|nr:anti-anti-sigma factor/polymer biosynthesis protein, WecB/TagA/CpsF family [Opitutus sp. GAS368]